MLQTATPMSNLTLTNKTKEVKSIVRTKKPFIKYINRKSNVFLYIIIQRNILTTKFEHQTLHTDFR